MEVNPRGPVWTPVEKLEEQFQDKPPLHDLTHYPGIRTLYRATKSPEQYNRQAAMAIILNRNSIPLEKPLTYEESMSRPDKAV